MAGAARRHQREKSSAGPHRTEQVGLEHPVPVLAGDALELPLQENSGGVDQDVDVTHSFDRITRKRAEVSLRTSVDSAIADSLVPSFRISPTVRSMRGSSKSETTMLAPCRAIAFAIARPTPLPPPMTKATLFQSAPRVGPSISDRAEY